MQKRQWLSFIVMCLLCMFATGSPLQAQEKASSKQEAKEVAQTKTPDKNWQELAAKSLVGTWKNTNADSRSISKLRISVDPEEDLRISFWSPSSDDEQPYGPSERLHVLYESSEVADQTKSGSAVAFTTYEASYATMHFTLKLRGGVLEMEGAKIAKPSDEGKQRVSRIVNSRFTASGELPDTLNTTDDKKDPDEPNTKDADKKIAEREPMSNQITKKSKRTPKKAAPKIGNISGRIDTGSTMRGRLSLSPVPEKGRPTNGVIEIGGSRPRFSFTNLPEGEYSLTFKGAVNGATATYTWKELKIDTAGGQASTSLTLRGGK